MGLSLVPSLFLSLPMSDCISNVSKLAELYHDDLPSPECLESELHSWKIKWEEQAKHGASTIPQNLVQTLRHTCSIFPNLTALVSIYSALSQSPHALQRDRSVL